MIQFLKFILASCLGTALALILLFLILIGIGTSKIAEQTSSPTVTIKENSILSIKIPDLLPEQTNNVQIQGITFKDEKILGVHDIASSIDQAADDPQIKGIYLIGSMYDHGYSTLKIIRDALLNFKSKGKFIYSHSNYYNHKNYFLASTANQISIHPLGFIELNGFGAAIPFYKELMEKIGLEFNIYYAGEFKSATEPFRLSKMSDQNRLQLREYLESQMNEYVHQIAATRNLSNEELRSDFDLFKSYTPQKAVENKVIDRVAHEESVLAEIKSKLNIQSDADINFVSLYNYCISKGNRTDYSAKNKIAIIYAEGNITDAKGEEAEIGRRYLKMIRDIRNNEKIKAVVLRVNSPGGSALMSDEFLYELDLTREAGKPVVVSMGDYAASGGYYISCHADSIFASPHTLTGSIGVFALIPNFKVMADQKIGVDFDTIGTGPMANKFNLTSTWGIEESTRMQENINNTYDRFIKVVSEGRKLTIENTKEIAKGRIWTGKKAVEIGLVNRIGELKDAISSAAKLASLDHFRTVEYPTRDDAFQKLIKKFQGKEDELSSTIQSSIIKSELGEFYPYYKEWKELKELKGIQARLPIKIIY
ncbi:MAG: signal peptide peptidase SppA [Saprospiraceae bacterium]|nr:signal peptide peptidase SppA [Saprospiraceae bacterium]